MTFAVLPLAELDILPKYRTDNLNLIFVQLNSLILKVQSQLNLRLVE